MINSQEIIERSVYDAILQVCIALGYTLNPEDYLPVSSENQKLFQEDLSKLEKVIAVFGTGNNQSKGQMLTPRIVVNARGFYPGDVGLEKTLIEKQVGVGYTANEEPYESLNEYIDVHLVADNQEDLRLLHQILFWSIPNRGYIKPYDEESFLFTGNIFIELMNFYDEPLKEVGILEKIYEFRILDSLLGERTSDQEITPLYDISVFLNNEEYDGVKEPLIRVMDKYNDDDDNPDDENPDTETEPGPEEDPNSHPHHKHHHKHHHEHKGKRPKIKS